VTVEPAKSTSLHRRAHSCERRAPVVAASRMNMPKSGSSSSIRPSAPASASGAGGVIWLGGADGAVAASAGFDATRPHFIAWANAAWRITCTLRTDAGASGWPFAPPPLRRPAWDPHRG
jgi:hypothetical protein